MPEITIHRNVRAFVEGKRQSKLGSNDSRYESRWVDDATVITGLPANAEVLGVIVKREPQPREVSASDDLYVLKKGHLLPPINVPLITGETVVDFLPIAAPESDAERVRREAREAAMISAISHRNNGQGLSELAIDDIIDAYEAKLREHSP